MSDDAKTYRLGKGSVNPGAVCPVCGEPLRIGAKVVRCPVCLSYSHLECWDHIGAHCGRVGCSGAGVPDVTISLERSPVHLSSLQTIEARPPRIKIRPRTVS